MFGVIVGATAALVTVALLARRRRCRRGYGYSRHRGPGGRRHDRHWGHHGPRAWLARIADRIDATPEQERVMHEATHDLIGELRGLRAKLHGTRSQLGDAFGPERFDEERMGELFAGHDELLGSARKAVVGALARIHEVLEPRQREQLSRWIGRRGSFGPYRI